MEPVNMAIRVSELSFAYHNKDVLENVNFEVAKGKLTFILGKNGSGKSTLLKILAGLLKPQTGVIKISGKDSSGFSIPERARFTGLLNQQHEAVFPFFVEDVVLTGRAGYVNYLPKKSDSMASLQAMEKVGIEHLRHRKYTELSGGEQQMVMIARLLAQNPEILLLDEPTTYLDFTNQSHLLNLLKELSREGLTIVVVMHDPNLAFLFGDDFLFIKDNQTIRAEGAYNAWDIEFLKSIYQGNFETIPYKDRALLIPWVK